MRHSLSHIMAQAVLKLYPNAKMAIGPAIDNGFYYDFDLGEDSFAPEDLKKIQKEMKKIIGGGQKFEQFSLPIKEAKEKLKDNLYKIEMIEDLEKEGEKEISFYKNINAKGEDVFVDMCRGPHLESTKEVGAFKLDKVAGAYWRGDEKNKMLQRIYGLAFEKKEELDDYLKLIEEAEKRDHKKLGKELELFSFHDVGAGFPFFKPKGVVVWNQLMKYWREAHDKAGYSEVKTPVILSRELWEKSGHWDNYRENMYTTKIDDHDYAIKPMNCPGGMLLYKEGQYSYRDLPLRWAEIGLDHRHELSGTLNGLFRARAFWQDDAHIFMRTDQIKEEIFGVLKLADEIYSAFGLSYHLELSTRPEKSIGTDEAWEKATKGLQDALDEYGQGYELNEGDGAFYGPKIDIHVKDALGRTWQCATIQLDMNLPERFDLNYVNEKGEDVRPVMIHRVIFGSVERFFGILVEHFAGAFPLWLSPEQVRVLPVSEKFDEYAKEVNDKLVAAGLRSKLDNESESLNKRIRNAEKSKLPYILVIGEKEQADKTVAVRKRKEGDLGAQQLDKFIKQLEKENKERIN